MWKFIYLCVIAVLCRNACGNIGDEMTEIIQRCCDDGSSFARNNTEESCSSSQPDPVDVPPAFSSLCVIARVQCCRDFYKKKRDCDTGVEEAANIKQCGSTKDSGKVCCDECKKGMETGADRGALACKVKSDDRASAVDLLTHDAFVKCCLKAADNVSSHVYHPVPTLKQKREGAASLCEDFAPNELCAHHCIPVPGSYRCECNPGYMLMADGRNCKQAGKNRCKPRNDCQHKCNDNGVEVMCSCRRGYELMPDGKSCQDIDECQLDIPVCLAGTQCHNIQGSFRCIAVKSDTIEKGKCPPGFTRNLLNQVCDDINECELPNPPCPSYVCENTVGAYKCGGVLGDPANLNNRPGPVIEDRCPPGFTLGAAGECEDVDECANHKDDCNPRSQFCINTHSSFYCQDMASKHCSPGFKINPVTNKCEDIDECEENSDLCRTDQICVNQLGQYDCKPKPDTSFIHHQCPDGMRMNPAKFLCEDIDECFEGTHLCDQHQNCLNTNGSFECHCKIGYELDITTGGCVDVNECATGQHDCIIGSQRCDNTVGSFLCIRITSCGTGYILQHATGNCEDIDECALGIHNCVRAGPEFQCFNIPGSFRCVRKRPTTTSTTTTPASDYIYDDEYYSEEVTDDQDANKPAPPIPVPVETASQPPISSSTTEAPTTPFSSTVQYSSSKPEEEPKIEDNFVVPETTEATERQHTPQPSLEQPSYDFESPKYPSEPPPDEPESKPTEAVISYSEPQAENQNPDIVFSESNTETPERKKIPDSTYYETREENPTKSNEIPPEIDDVERQTESQPQVTTEPQRRPTYSPYGHTSRPSRPPQVYVNVETTSSTARSQYDSRTVTIPRNPVVDCPPGFENNEYGGCFDIDECETKRHSCSGLTESCRNTIGGYLCDCAVGFRRDFVTGACDIAITSSTTTSTTTPPPPRPTVHEPVSSTSQRIGSLFWGYRDDRLVTTRPFRPRNWCDAGYQLNSRTGRCEDINECENDQATCAAVEICINTEGGFRCECPADWSLDNFRHRCVPNYRGGFPPGYGNEPDDSVPSLTDQQIIGGASNNSDVIEPDITDVGDRGSVLQCPWGYRLGDGDNCEDVNECVTGEAKCGPLQLCMNLPGGYSCSCAAGYRLVGDHECRDVDECAIAGNQSICSHNADCVNTIGSYQCRCHNGFRPAPINDKVCVDVDECSEARVGTLCQHRCSNVWGRYRCSCHRGYRLNSDNRTCSDVDECVEFKSKLPCEGKCLNEPGSYRCACPPGYRLSENKRSCIDIDECETKEATCETGVFGGTSHVCFNTRGSYRCQRISCPPGYQLESKHRCTKTERVCRPGDWDCAHQPTTISYNFITFVSKLYVPDSKVKLFTMRGPSWTYANMKFELRLVDVNAPPSVKDRADITAFLLTQDNNEAVMSLVRPLEGPQSIELELSMELYSRDQFGGIAVAKVFIFVSEYEF